MRKSKKWIWNENVPIHLKTYADTTSDIELLINSHVSILEKETEEDENIIMDRDSIFLRSAITLLCSAWEAYTEDLLTNAIMHLTENSDYAKIPKSLKKCIANNVKIEKDELAPWLLAGNSWKEYTIKYLNKRVSLLNTPKSDNIKLLYEDFLGIDILNNWHWEYEYSKENIIHFNKEETIKWIDGFVSDRCAIAHGRPSTREYNVFFFNNVLLRINTVVALMNNRVSEILCEISGNRPWELIFFKPDWSPYLKEEN